MISVCDKMCEKLMSNDLAAPTMRRVLCRNVCAEVFKFRCA